MRTPIRARTVPRAVGPYSQAIAAGNWILVSGQIGLDPTTGTLVEGGTAAEARQALKNIAAILKAAGCTLDGVVKTTVYLVDLSDFALVNEIYAECFREPYPARSTVGVATLPRGARVEIEALAMRK